MNRRHDIDWVRVIAIGLLLIYHTAVGFQPWGIMIGFITNSEAWELLWTPMAMLNVWRIPLLFFVSGMGVYFALQNRKWQQLIKERAMRILVPFIFGLLIIAPLQLNILQWYYGWTLSYSPGPAHLWFLGNIFLYVLLLSPLLFYLNKNEHGKVASTIKRIFSTAPGLLLVNAAFIAEALLAKPFLYEMYAMTWHGFFIGLIAFLFGFCFVQSGASFWKMLSKGRWIFLLVAALLFTYRLTQLQMRVPAWQMAIESNYWIFSVLTFAHRYLNRPGKALSYLSEAAYPVYIIHMLFLFLASLLIFPLNIAVEVKFILTLLFTFGGCFVCYEFIIRRVNFIRPLFGLKRKKETILKFSVSPAG